ncbi:hypothetical protein CHS0354_010613 [Potamilus streckersoni]|uniref:Uncharacterized protein n=1 Tax=Potamilus streckersoni TaxID=2493646 RepID=A0AAE0SFS0_9BIVA|nr:hypothetical protein CHS0354_010613 [Potamilus streckersoni]
MSGNPKTKKQPATIRKETVADRIEDECKVSWRDNNIQRQNMTDLMKKKSTETYQQDEIIPPSYIGVIHTGQDLSHRDNGVVHMGQELSNPDNG